MNFDEIITAMAKAKALIGRIETLRSNLDREWATQFSIFEPTGSDERTFSKIIRLLLDPKGSHGQGSLFLKAFLEHLYETFQDNDKIKNFLNLDLKKATVVCDSPTGKGRFIDVTVKIEDKKFGIENKHWFKDLDDQVSNYLEAVDFLVYLSIDRKSPHDRSIPKTECEKAIHDGRLLLMHYECSQQPSRDMENISEERPIADFSEWLKRCEQIAKPDKIRWYLGEISQRINTYLYGRSPFMSDAILNKEDVLLDNKDATNAFLELYPLYWDLAKKLVDNFCSRLKGKFDTELKLEPLAGKWEMGRCNTSPSEKGTHHGGEIIISIIRRGVENEQFSVFFYENYYREMFFQWESKDTSHHTKFLNSFNTAFLNSFNAATKDSNEGCAWIRFPERDFRTLPTVKKLYEFYKDQHETSELAGITRELVERSIDFLKKITTP